MNDKLANLVIMLPVILIGLFILYKVVTSDHTPVTPGMRRQARNVRNDLRLTQEHL